MGLLTEGVAIISGRHEPRNISPAASRDPAEAPANLH